MNQYQCSDPAQNHLPEWMNCDRPAESGAADTADAGAEPKPAQDSHTTGFPVFTYKKAPFFPEFCRINRK